MCINDKNKNKTNENGISIKYAEHINTFALLLITVVGFYRLNAAAVCL